MEKTTPNPAEATKRAAQYLKSLEAVEGLHFVNTAYLLTSIRFISAMAMHQPNCPPELLRAVVSAGATFAAQFVKAVGKEREYTGEQRVAYREKLIAVVDRALNMVMESFGDDDDAAFETTETVH